jgi:glycosyltransferase involved in cell wall biosynthesis
MTTSLRSVHVVVPDDIDDVAVPSGGNAYDRRVCLGLSDTGCSVHELAVAGGWPRPDAAARESLARTLSTLPDDAVVLIDGLVACGVPDVVVPQARRLKIVVLVHLPLGDEVGAAPSAAAELAALERETLHAASAVVATSSWVARRLVATHSLAADRIQVATPGADPAPLAAGTDGASRLLCVGSITPTKGQDLLVEALATVHDAAGDLPWSCDLTGPLSRNPVHVAAVRSMIDRHGLGARVRLTGPKTGERLEAAYAEADLLVLPSRVEAYGMVVTEALARGIPVLAAAVGGVPESLGYDPGGRVPGILVPPADVAALAEALRRWFGDPALRDWLRGTARRRRDTLDGWGVTSRCLAEVLERLNGTPA